MSKRVYIARNYRSKFDAAGKAKMDCETILQNNGWKNLGFKQTWISNGLLGTLISALGVTWAILRLPFNSTICLQYPFNKFYRYSIWAANLKKCKVVTLVHDVVGLKKRYKDPAKEIDLLSRSDVLILHTNAMQTWFEEQKVDAKIVRIEAFDYLHTPNPDSPNARCQAQQTDFEKLSLVFAGNMGTKKSFLYDLDSLPRANFKLDLYGVGFLPEKIIDPNDTILQYNGMFPADKVIDNIVGDFGLVWYGNSIDSCDGETGQYMKYNSPHKLSLYVLCGMPIIIWKKAAMAGFVESNNIGISVDSLSELPEKLKQLTPQEMSELTDNLSAVREKMISGQYLTEALTRAEQALD
jgi:hypothetical protein